MTFIIPSKDQDQDQDQDQDMVLQDFVEALGNANVSYTISEPAI